MLNKLKANFHKPLLGIQNMVNWIMVPQICSYLNPQTLLMLSYVEKENEDVIKTRLLVWDFYPGLFRWVWSNYKGFRKRATEGVRDRESDVITKAKIGVMCFQGVGSVHKLRGTCRSWKRKRKAILLRASRSNQPSWNLYFIPLGVISDFWTQETHTHTHTHTHESYVLNYKNMSNLLQR